MPVACTIVTGSLNVGKTTFIQALIKARPQNEKWAILVNEFGACGVDGALLETGGLAGVVVKELAGGCMCCALNGPLTSVIAQLLRQAKPDRLIIEPSGLGHPAGLLDVLSGEHLRSAITLQAVICLVDVRSATELGTSGSEVALDQISVSDVIVGTKSDLASEQQVERFEEWAAGLWPPKAQVLCAVRGHLPDPCQLLSATHKQQHRPFFTPVPGARRRQQQQQQQPSASNQQGSESGALAPSAAGQHTQGSSSTLPNSSSTPQADDGSAAGSASRHEPGAPTPGAPTRFLNVPTDSPHHVACGWLFHPSDVFDRQQLTRVLLALHPHVVRLKGIFRCGKKAWVTPEFGSQAALGAGARAMAAAAAAAAAAVPDRADPDVHSSTVREADAPVGVRDAATPSASTQCALKPVCYRRDSRVELIVSVAKGHMGPVMLAAGGANQLVQAESDAAAGLCVDVARAVATQDWHALESLLLSAVGVTAGAGSV